MAVYGRSDVAHVTISADHGGCGNPHSRPVVHGAPAKVWELKCPQCEDFLRHDPLWSPMPGAVPETPDEKTAREASESRSQLDLEKSNAEAFTQLANAVSGNALAMGKLVELMAILAPSQEKLDNGHVQGEVLSRAREVGKPASPPPPPPPPVSEVKTEAPVPKTEAEPPKRPRGRPSNPAKA